MWKRGDGSRPLRGAPLGAGAAASPPRRPSGATPRGLQPGEPVTAGAEEELERRSPCPSSGTARDVPGASGGGPGPPDLGCPQGWANDLSPSAAAPAAFPEQVSGVAVKFTTGIGGQEWKLAPSQVFIPFGPL